MAAFGSAKLDDDIAGPIQPERGEFSKGLRAGMLGAESQLNSFAGGAGGAMGFDNFAAGRHAAAQQLAEEAQRVGPRVGSYRDVGSLRDALDFGAGLAGQAVPSVGIGLGAGALTAATGGGAAAAMLAGGLAQAPLEIGDVVQRQQQDPAARLRSAGENFGQAALIGGASSLAQGIVPGAVGGKLLGAGVRGAEKAAAGSLRAAILRDAAVEGLSEGGGEALKQQAVTPGQLQWDPIIDNAIGGALIGGPLGGVGHVADAAHSVPGGIGQGIKDLGQFAADKTQALATGAKNAVEAAPGAMDTTGKAAGEMLNRFREAVKPKEADPSETAGVALSPDELAEVANPATARERLVELANKGMEKASEIGKKTGEWISKRADIDPETRQRAADLMADASDEAQRLWGVTTKKALELKDQTSTQLKNLSEAVTEVAGKVKAKTEGKKSEDFSGIRQAIAERLLPNLPEHVVNDPAAAQQVAEATRQFISTSAEGNPLAIERAVNALRPFLGENTEDVLADVYRAVGDSNPKAAERFFGALNQSKEAAGGTRELTSTIESALPEELKANAPQITEALRDWVRGRNDTPGSAGSQFSNSAIREEINRTFGKNADRVFKALEKDMDAEALRSQFDVADQARAEGEAAVAEGKHGNGAVNEAEAERTVHSTQYTKSGKPVPMQNPELYASRFEGNVAPALKLIEKLNNQFKGPDGPTKSARWISEAEFTGNPDASRERGFVVVDDMPKEGAISDAGLRKSKLDRDKAEGSPSRIDVPIAEGDRQHFGVKSDTLVLDAVKLAREGMNALKKTKASDGATDAQRLARGFFEAVSQLYERFGVAPKISESTVIGYIGNKPFTAGDAKRLDPRSEADKKADNGRRKMAENLAKLREEYRDADEEGRAAIKERAAELLAKSEDAKAKSLLAGADEAKVDSIAESILNDTGRYELNPDANIHERAAVEGEDNLAVNGERPELRAKPTKEGRQWQIAAAALEEAGTAPARAVAKRLDALAGIANAMSKADRSALNEAVLADGRKVSTVAPVVNDLFAKYKDVVKTPKVQSDGNALSPEARERQTAKEAALEEEGPQDPKAQAAKKAALSEAASSSDPALLEELRTTTDGKALGRTARYLADDHPNSEAARVAGERFDELAADPDTAYSMQRATGGGVTANARANVETYVERVLGKSVAVEWANIPHAGEYTVEKGKAILRLSTHALNPQSVAYHEALHAFFGQIRDSGNHQINAVLDKAASQGRVLQYMQNHFKNEPAVLRQLRSDPEERAAYMYQLWASDKNFRAVLNPQATTIFQRVAEAVRKVLGIWSNDQRALHILEHFHFGEYAKNIGKPDVTSLLKQGTNPAIEKGRELTAPLMRFYDTVFTTGAERLRDTGITPINEIADLIHPPLTAGAKRQGWLSASREQRATRMNAYATAVQGASKEETIAALKALQTGNTSALSAGAAHVVAETKKLLQETGAYMRDKGLQFGDLGEDYFPRIWDPGMLAKRQNEFLAMMDKYVQTGEYKGDPHDLLLKLIANDGMNLDVDTRRPGMQNIKERELAFITGADAEPFLSKDLFQTVNSYVSQATRRAEWAARFGHDGSRLNALLEDAKKEGATSEQLKTTEQYIKGVIGTLGDGLNPTARRLMGNAIVYQNVRLLPLAIFSSVVDPVGIVVRGGTVSDAFNAFKRGVREIPKNFKAYDANRDSSTALAETLGTIDNAALLHSVGALYSQGMVGDTARKWNDTFFRFNLMEQFNTSMRVGATEAALKFIQRQVDRPGPHSERWLSELGLTKDDVQIDGGRVKLFQSEGLSAQHEAKMRAAVNKWVDGAVLRPNQADKPIWMNDPHFMLVAHLKQFVYAFQHTIIDRVVHEFKEGNYSPAMALASYVPIMIASDYMKGFIQGGGEQPAWKRDWGVSDWVNSGVERAGLYGVGQFTADTLAGNFGSLTGPTIEQLGDAVSVLGGKERFGDFALKSLPANSLYKGTVMAD